MKFRPLTVLTCCALTMVGVNRVRGDLIETSNAQVSASSTNAGSTVAGAVDGDALSVAPAHGWQGAAGQESWWWQVRFPEAREVGAILQVMGDHDFVLRNTPLRYVWKGSDDGEHWRELNSTATTRERREFRLHRLPAAQAVKWLRLEIAAASGAAPTLREVRFYSSPTETVAFPDWIVVVNTTDDPGLPGPGREFIPLARSCAGWSETPAQQVWLGDFDQQFIDAEPRPLCAFLSGNFKDWCQVAREPWRGVEGVLRSRRLPLWASCGGAQGLAILAETGVDGSWDCPHCRDPLAPKTPIYSHIGHTGVRPCGDYSACVFERGPHRVRRLENDPVFAGLPEEFTAMESHCGQIEWPPKGWRLIATAGPGSRTRTQCLRLDGRYIYAAQFHIEMEGAPAASRRIMSNFLGLAQRWRQEQSNAAAAAGKDR